MALNIKLTYRQKVLLKLLKYDGQIFSKRSFVPTTMDERDWKYTNSLVDGNCLWFGGRTTRKDTKERGRVHQKELGLRNKLKLIVHADANHRSYRMNKDSIKKYLLATVSKKMSFSNIGNAVDSMEQEYDVKLRDIIIEEPVWSWKIEGFTSRF